MEMTLDEYLAEIDRWKEAVSDRVAKLPVSERTEAHRDARAWLEAQLGRPLREASEEDAKAVAQA